MKPTVITFINIAALVVVGFVAVHAYGALDGAGILAAVWLLTPNKI